MATSWMRWRVRLSANTWLAAGAVTVGLGAAVISGAAIASADDGSATSSSTTAATSAGPEAKAESAGESEETASEPKSETSASETGQAETSASDSSVTEKAGPDRDEPKSKRFGSRRDHAEKAATESDSSTGAAADDTSVVAPVATSALPDEADVSAQVPVSAKVTRSDRATESERAPPLSLVATEPGLEAAEPASAPVQALFENIIRQLQYTFANVAPTVEPGSGTPAGNGVVTGELNGKSNNGFGVTYTVTQQGQHGFVTVDQETGLYTYTASAHDPRVTDSFVITADNGVEARLPGLAGAVQGYVHSLAQGLGLAQADTVSVLVSVKAAFAGTVGDPENAVYWAEQNFNDCVLMSVAMMTGQLRGIVPTDQTEKDIIEEASETDSISHPGQKMWYSSTQLGVSIYDGEQLLKNHGFETEFRYYGDRPFSPGTTLQGTPALNDLKLDLEAGNAVMVDVNARSIWAAEQPGYTGNSDFTTKNHAIVVLAVDYDRGLVYVNDSGLHTGAGQGAAVSLPAFMWAWAASGYVTVVAKKPAVEEEESLQLAA